MHSAQSPSETTRTQQEQEQQRQQQQQQAQQHKDLLKLLTSSQRTDSAVDETIFIKKF